MSRTLNSPVASQRSEFVYLYDIDYSGGTLYLTNAPADIAYGGNTYVALGGSLLHDAITETQDRKGQGLTIKLFGVNQSIISTILNNQFRHQEVRIRLVHFDPDTGVMNTPDLVWRGRQLGDYNGTESRDRDTGGTCTLEVRVSSALDMLNQPNGVRCNTSSHNEMLRRAGQSISPMDDFFMRIPTIAAINIYWGTEAPSSPSWSSTGGTPTGGKAKRREN